MNKFLRLHQSLSIFSSLCWYNYLWAHYLRTKDKYYIHQPIFTNILNKSHTLRCVTLRFRGKWLCLNGFYTSTNTHPLSGFISITQILCIHVFFLLNNCFVLCSHHIFRKLNTKGLNGNKYLSDRTRPIRFILSPDVPYRAYICLLSAIQLIIFN